MKKLLGLTLGIMTALGGFLDLGQIVFTAQAGAMFSYQLLWAIVIGTVAIIVYMEMCGRIAVVAREPVFAIVRTRLGFRLGVVVLVASNLLNMITCAAELAGTAIVIHLLTGWPEKVVLAGSALTLGGMVWLLSFRWIERIFGLSGLLMIVFAVSAIVMHPDWEHVVQEVLPYLHQPDMHHALLYWYFAVGIFSAMLMVYEVHFYSSGAIEEDWKVSDLSENFVVATFGSILGSLLTVALLIVAAVVFVPNHIYPELLSTTVMAAALPFAQKALVIALLGTLACIAGASIETTLSSAYNLCQFFNLRWGKDLPAREARAYTAAWVGMFALSTAIAMLPVRPLQLINVSVIFGMVVMPLTYYPILRTAADKKMMGTHVNSRAVTATGIAFLVLITLAALAAIPLMVVTHSGRP